ncbi:hypothetical protein Ciccas_003352 [Cichlidogyrus casuarinus]|uniref:Uncharacterized protein n=1 Tax=Cichlidogyrus casuarinus TaxID=1844966 RepID=A0ABD2QFA2_9PLAT
MLKILFLSVLFHNAVRTEKSEFWIGNAPVCEGAMYECSPLDMDLVKFDERGPPDSESCEEGYKALCRMPKPKAINQTQVDATKLQLKILNYDMDLRNAGEPGTENKGENERICFVGRALYERFSDVDVVVMFGMRIRNCLRTKVTIYDYMTNYGWIHHVQNGQTIIFSKYNIRLELALNYLSPATTSMITRLKKEDHEFRIITHDLHDTTYGRNFTKILERTEAFSRDLWKYLDSHITRGPAILVESTPFDSQVEAYRAGIINLYFDAQLLVPPIKPSVLKGSNEFADSYLAKWYKDETVVKNSSQENHFAIPDKGLKPSRSKLETVDDFQTDESSPILYCKFTVAFADQWIFHITPECLNYKQTRQLSSHYPVLGTFTFS